MPASAVKKWTNEKEWISKPKKTKFRTDSVFPVFFVIFQYLQAKWQQFLGYTVECCSALGRQLRKFLTVAQIEKTSFLLLQLYAKAAKQRLLNQTNHSKPFYNMITKTDDDDLKI